MFLSPDQTPFGIFCEILERAGIRAALQYLNSRSAHRFTALYRFEGGTLQNLHLIDRDDPTVERTPDLPVLESYCVYVRNTARTFLTEDSWSDPRVVGHPKQQRVRSYCGVPLVLEDGKLYGTLCHFDYDAILYAEEEIFLLDAAAPLLIKALLKDG